MGLHCKGFSLLFVSAIVAATKIWHSAEDQ